MLLMLMQGVTTFVREEAAGGLSEPPDETSSFVAVWDMEEASGTRANAATASGGTDCDLVTINGTPVQDTSDFIEGSASVELQVSGPDGMEAAAATCDEVAGITGSMTVFTFARIASDTSGVVFNTRGGNDGMVLQRTGSSDYAICKVGDGSDRVTCVGATNGWEEVGVDPAFQFAACVAEGGATDEIRVYMNGAASGSPCTQQDIAAGTDPVQIGRSSSGTTDWDGEIDMMGVYDGVLSEAELCYLCSSGGPANDASMTCLAQGSSFDAVGLNASNCGSCSLAAIDCQDPITP